MQVRAGTASSLFIYLAALAILLVFQFARSGAIILTGFTGQDYYHQGLPWTSQLPELALLLSSSASSAAGQVCSLGFSFGSSLDQS